MADRLFVLHELELTELSEMLDLVVPLRVKAGMGEGKVLVVVVTRRGGYTWLSPLVRF